MNRKANLNGCRLKFAEVRYIASSKTTFRATIFDRPNNAPNLLIEMGDWDALLYHMDQLFTGYNVKYPLPVLTYDKNFKLINS